ncbi:uncharacterized protein LOC135134583 isoform X2 [Zophobas morio]|uniref:uncharacterized protein LOC135134583 isoform X2 n=1 Tax=Zophobas morio TaxID=2755281 RepID=UPI0030833ACC
MEFEAFTARSRMCRCHCRRRRETNPLFRAVLSNDLNELKALVESGNSVNIQNTKGSALLNFVMRRKRVEIFDYLMSLDEVDVNFLDRSEQSPLIYLGGICFDEYFALELIKKGADIHSTDSCGFTFLHLAAKCESDDNLNVGQLIIEKGGDLDYQAQYGVTALYCACESGNFDWVCMLLYYGADVTIATDRGVLPVAVISQDISDKQQLQLQEILFNYTFDENKIIIKLPTLVAAMMLNSDLFPKILNHISDVDYDVQDLQYLVSSLIHVKSQHLKLFIERFGYIVKDMIDNYPPIFDVLIKIALNCGIKGVKEIVDIFSNSAYITEFIQSSNISTSTIALLLEVLGNEDELNEEDFTKTICLLLSHGLTVTSCDLDAVYQHFGYCELFKILLHMDVFMTSSNIDEHSMAVLFYDPLSNIDDLVVDVSLCTILLDYFNHPKLKDFILKNSDDGEQLEKVKKLPQVPLLVELSRNAAREFIVNRFRVRNSMQFYTILQWLPIGDMNKSIIALEKKLY